MNWCDIIIIGCEKMIEEILNEISEEYPELPQELYSLAKNVYSNDRRPKETIKDELYVQIQRYQVMEKLISMPINEDVLTNSILLIGPMGAGKSTISKRLQEDLQLPRISLDDRETLSSIYLKRNHFANFKEFEFYLTSNVLSSLKEPTIIDFGAGHSIYENPLMFYEMKKFLSRFQNIVFLIPSQDKEESLSIINQRLVQKGNSTRNQLNDNSHFVYSPCNEMFATLTEYTFNMTPDQISTDILEKLQLKQNQPHHL